MAQTTTKEPTLSRSDAFSIWMLIAAGAAIFVYTLVQGVLRVIELAANSSVQVPAEFAGTTAEAPIGANGATVAVELDRAILTVDSLPAASIAAGVLEVATVVIATGVTLALLALLSRELLRGHIFSRRNTRLVGAAGVTVVLALALAPFFGNMVANGAFARLSDRTFDNVVIASDLQVLLLAAFVAAFVASVFAVGDRLQRETEGLV